MPSESPVEEFRILYFASATAFTRKSTEYLPSPLAVRDLFALLETRYPGIERQILSSCAVTLNLEYVDLEDEQASITTVTKGDEVAIIPPVSSG